MSQLIERLARAKEAGESSGEVGLIDIGPFILKPQTLTRTRITEIPASHDNFSERAYLANIYLWRRHVDPISHQFLFTVLLLQHTTEDDRCTHIYASAPSYLTINTISYYTYSYGQD